MAVLFYIIIGPAFAAPRTALTAYEMGIKPFIADPAQWQLTLFSCLFFVVAMFFSWRQGKLLDVIGKVLTPVLFLGLLILSVMVFIDPQGDILAAQGAYATQPMITGMLEGYNTMDTFGVVYLLSDVFVCFTFSYSFASIFCLFLFLFSFLFSLASLFFVIVLPHPF